MRVVAGSRRHATRRSFHNSLFSRGRFHAFATYLRYPISITNCPIQAWVRCLHVGCLPEDSGFVYIVKSEGFKNEPKGSWQFVKETEEIDFIAVVETENDDFTYSVEIFNDFD